MSEYIVKDYEFIRNAVVYGLNESVKRSKYPMATETELLTSKITETTKKLANCEKGSGHDQFLTGIIVQFDLEFTVKAWTEAERYSFLDFVSSQSTMHRIANFDYNLQYSKYVDKRVIEIMKELKALYEETQDKEDYLRLLYTNPCGFKLIAGMTTNYRQLKTIYSQRKNHRLPEWRTFCKWIETLPESYLITGVFEYDPSRNEAKET